MFKYLFNSSKYKVAVVKIIGIINADKRIEILKLFKKIRILHFNVLFLEIDSPGGTVTDSEIIYQEILQLKEEKNLYVVASYGNVAASGAVYLSMAADRIYSQVGTITGSIGVIMKSYDLSKLYEKIGINTQTIKSGLYKDILSVDRPMIANERAMLQDMINDVYTLFIQTIAKGRGLKIVDIKSFSDGSIYSGLKAYKYKMVDALGTQQDAKKGIIAALDGTVAFIEINPYRPKRSRLGALFKLFRTQALMRDLQGIPLWLYEQGDN